MPAKVRAQAAVPPLKTRLELSWPVQGTGSSLSFTRLPQHALTLDFLRAQNAKLDTLDLAQWRHRLL